MNAVYFLLPAALILSATFLVLYLRAVKQGQFDDLDDPPMRILQDD
ncbi:MAG: cbb3-type cytochrome oxidase assembly protein CcoS [Alphaproteobacteria bacterium]|nr:cbb3-type cytochrome oxidase assembly protein CcoS [Alphaproteobacteria bacterium]